MAISKVNLIKQKINTMCIAQLYIRASTMSTILSFCYYFSRSTLSFIHCNKEWRLKSCRWMYFIWHLKIRIKQTYTNSLIMNFLLNSKLYARKKNKLKLYKTNNGQMLLLNMFHLTSCTCINIFHIGALCFSCKASICMSRFILTF